MYRISPLLAMIGALLVGVRAALSSPPNTPAATYALIFGYEVAYGLAFWLVFWLIERLILRFTPSIVARPLPIRLLVPGLLCLGLLPALPALGRGEAPEVALPAAGTPVCRVEWLAIDGADLDDLRRLSARGDLPNFARLLAEGASAPLQTISPHSPVVWTSVATSRAPADHGIRSYTSFWLSGTSVALPDDPWDILVAPLLDAAGLRIETAVGSTGRQVPAIWEIASRFNAPTFFLNWWATWPADPVVGRLITNLALPWNGFTAADLASPHPRATWPAELQDQTAATLAAYVRETGADHLVRNAFSLEGAEFFVARDALVWRMRAEFRPEGALIVAPYMQEVDTSSHAWNHEVYGAHVNKKRKKKIPDAEADALWERMITAAYRRMDGRVGEVLSEIAASPAPTCLIVSSDHGWDYDGTSHYNKPAGTFLAYGPPFRPGALPGKVRVYDVLPVVTTLIGLPLSAESEGRVPDGLFLTPPAPATVPSYGPRAQVLPASAEADEGHLERLRALGYIE